MKMIEQGMSRNIHSLLIGKCENDIEILNLKINRMKRAITKFFYEIEGHPPAADGEFSRCIGTSYGLQ